MLALLACVFVMGAPTAGEAMKAVEPARVRGTVERLASFGTRHTLSETESDVRGIGAARRWLDAELRSYGGGVRVVSEAFDVPRSARVPEGAHLVNIYGVIEGTDQAARKRAYLVVGHYDSRVAGTMDAASDAPGANDDASGTAVALEVARVLADRPLEATVIVLCTAGEEQGLLGAKHAAEASEVLRGYEVMGVLSNDIVGDPVPAPAAREGAVVPRHALADARTRVRVFSEGMGRTGDVAALARVRQLAGESDSPSRGLARFIAEVAEKEVTVVQPLLVFRPDRFLRGGDHLPFNERGIAAVRFTTVYEDYSRQHADVGEEVGADGVTRKVGDLAEFVDAEYLAEVTRLNVAAVVHLASAPSVPRDVRVVTAGLATDTTLRWSASPEGDVAGYEVVWRETTAADWEHSTDAGMATEVTIALSKDNYLFGVRAYDRDGFRSPAVFAGAAER